MPVIPFLAKIMKQLYVYTQYVCVQLFLNLLSPQNAIVNYNY